MKTLSRNETRISVLAVCETILAVSIWVFIAVKFNTINHILASILVTPFLLLRTNLSEKYGLKFFNSIVKREHNIFVNYISSSILGKLSWEVISILIILSLSLFCSITIIIPIIYLVKIFITIYFLVKKPIHSLKMIPHNWYRIVFIQNITHVPEILPGVERNKKKLKSLSSYAFNDFLVGIKSYIFLFKDQDCKNKKVFFYANLFFPTLINMFFFILYIPAIFYRYSIKSTAIIYLPFIWLLAPNRKKSTNIKIIIDDIIKWSWEKVKIWYSCLVIFGFTLLPFIIVYYSQKLLDSFGSSLKIWNYFFLLQLNEIYSWHITRFAGAVITLFLFFYANKKNIRFSHGDFSSERIARNVIYYLDKLRTLLTFWTIGCGLYILIRAADWTFIRHIKIILIPK